MSRAGWSGGKFSAVKLWKSSSISGPSETVKPIRAKMSIISFLTTESGCRVPSGASTGKVRSRPDAVFSVVLSIASFKATIFSCTAFFKPLISCPTSLRSSGGTDLKSANRAGISPFLLKNLIRNASNASILSALNALTSSKYCVIFSFIIPKFQ